jgi:DNA-binding transcriptional LysR family regulator
MSTPSFSETSAVLAVLEHKSFTKAADHLGLSPARVSELVRKFEDRLGVRLLKRTTRSVAATQAGSAFSSGYIRCWMATRRALDSLNDFAAGRLARSA